VKAFADTSFVISAFVQDEFNNSVWRWWKRHSMASVFITPLVLFEAENSIRGFPIAGKCVPDEARSALEGIKRGLLEGLFICQSVHAKRLFPQATRLSFHHTLSATFGAMDVLHVASAMELGADTFLTFDKRQGEMAAAEGLKVKP